jgi:hypothetical protein
LEAAFLLVEEDAVDEETFACAVLANDGDDAEGSVFGEGEEKFLCLFGEGETDTLLVGDEGDGEGGLIF